MSSITIGESLRPKGRGRFLSQSTSQLTGAAVLLMFVLLATTSVAQDFDRYRPKTLDNREGESRLPETPPGAIGDPKILVDQLKGLIFVDRKEKVVVGKLQDRGIHIRGDGLFILQSDAFHQLVEPYLGGPISLRRLNEMVRQVIIFYRANGQPVVDVSVPEQDITDGVVQVVVNEGRVGDVYVEGPCFFNPSLLAAQPYISHGDVIYESVLMEDLKWLNRNPFRTVDLELTPGEVFGETDIVFNVHDQRPVRGYIGYEDTGTRQTGLERLLVGVNWGNAFGRDHQMGFQYTASTDFETLEAYSGVYEIPLANRDTLQFFGSFAEINSPVTVPFGLTGVAWQLSARYNHTLCPRFCLGFEQRLVAGFDFKQTNTNLDFGGATVFASSADIAQFMVGYQASRYDDWGSLSLGADLTIGPGSWFSSNNTDAAFTTIRAAADTDYLYTRMVAERQILLPSYMTFVARVTGQIADGNLLPSEQLGFGGYNSIRGYDMRLINGDSGYFVNLELRTDPISLGLGRCACDELQFVAFYDVGDSMNHTLLPGEDPSVDLNGAGVGLRYSISPTFRTYVDYGWQLNDVGPATTVVTPPGRWHVGAILSY